MLQKQYVGILYYDERYKRISKADPKMKQQLSFIEEGAKKNGVTPCFFRMRDIKPGVYHIRALVLGKKGYQLKTIPRPTVIYDRMGARGKRKQIDKLIEDGITIFNVRRHDGKFPIWEILSKDSDIVKQVPFTMEATVDNIKEMMKKYNSLIIKPNIGAVGVGLMKIEKIEGQWCFSFTTMEGTSKVRKNLFFQDELPERLIKRINNKLYIVQERIPLATYQNSPFDIRVAVQRNHRGEWEPTAFITKVSKDGFYITNVYQGGTVYPLETIINGIPHLSYKKVADDISSFTVNIAKLLSEKLPHAGCLGMDIGITSDGTPYFIEVNYLSDFEALTFRDNEFVYEGWKRVYTTPIDYAAYLLKKQK